MGFLDRFLGKKKDKYFLDLGGDQSASAAPAPQAPAAKAPEAKQNARDTAKQAKDAEKSAAAAQKAEAEAAQRATASAAAAAEAEAVAKMGFADVMRTPTPTMRTRRPGPSLDKFKGMVKEMKK